MTGNVSQALARVKEIQARVAEHTPRPQSGDFKAALDNALEETGSSLQSARPASRPGSLPVQQHFTIGRFIGTGGVSLSPTIQRPAVDGVMTRDELEAYLEATGIRERNGHLTTHDLVEVSGGWKGRNEGLLEPAAVAWEKMREAATADGVDLYYIDAYRSWHTQNAAHQRYLSGEKAEHVLPAGTSEHGVGLALDFTDGRIIQKHSPEWNWLSQNARAFGWWPISNESWHWEFRGT